MDEIEIIVITYQLYGQPHDSKRPAVLSVKEVAYELGYEDVAHFSKFSKKIRGRLFRISVEARFIATENRRDESRLYRLNILTPFSLVLTLSLLDFSSFFSEKQNRLQYQILRRIYFFICYSHSTRSKPSKPLLFYLL